jgi:hypothetical protein
MMPEEAEAEEEEPEEADEEEEDKEEVDAANKTSAAEPEADAAALVDVAVGLEVTALRR